MRITILPLFVISLLLNSCGNQVEEIKDPSTGKLLKRYEYYTDNSGQKIKNGEYFEWDSSGKKLSELHYQNDSLNGECIFYSENGRVYVNEYSNGKLEGKQQTKLANGKVLSVENYSNDLLNGRQEYFFVSGKKLRIAEYKNGEPVGKWTCFSENSNKPYYLTFKNGVCQEFIGTWYVDGERATSMVFGKDGEFQLWAPYFDHFGDPELRLDGIFQIDKQLNCFHKNGMAISYSIASVSKNKIVLFDPENKEFPGKETILNRVIGN